MLTITHSATCTESQLIEPIGAILLGHQVLKAKKGLILANCVSHAPEFGAKRRPTVAEKQAQARAGLKTNLEYPLESGVKGARVLSPGSNLPGRAGRTCHSGPGSRVAVFFPLPGPHHRFVEGPCWEGCKVLEAPGSRIRCLYG